MSSQHSRRLLADAVRHQVHEEAGTEICWLPSIRPGWTASDFPYALPPGEQSGDASLALAEVVNEVPNEVGIGRWHTDRRMLWDVLRDVMDQASFPIGEDVSRLELAPDSEEARAVNALFEDESRTVPSEALVKYREFQSKWEEAANELEAVEADDAEVANTRKAEARGSLEEIERQWEASGNRAQVEGALDALGRASREHVASAWSRARTRLEIAERSGISGGTYSATTTRPIGFNPERDSSWAVVTTDTPADIETNGMLGGLPLADGTTLEAELAVVELRRSWLDPELLRARDWKIDGEPLSDGHTPAAGRLPGWADAILLARRIAVVSTVVEPDQSSTVSDSPTIGAQPSNSGAAARQFANECDQKLGLVVDPNAVVEVKSSDGSPVDAAKITQVVSGRDRRTKKGTSVTLESWTDEKGRALVPTVLHRGKEGEPKAGEPVSPVRVSGVGHTSLTFEHSSGVTHATLQKLSSFQVEVTTKLPISGSEKPIAGARVQLVVEDRNSEVPPGRVWHGSTDESGLVHGNMAFEKVPLHSQVLIVDAEGFQPQRIDDLSERGLSGLDRGSPVHISVQLDPSDTTVNGSSDAAILLAYVVTHLGRAPDPDPSLNWPSE